MGCGGLILVVLVIVMGGDWVDFGFLAMVVIDGWLILGGGGGRWVGGVDFKLF